MKKKLTTNTIKNLKVNSKEQFQASFEMFFDINEFDADTREVFADYLDAYKADFPEVDPETDCFATVRVNFSGGIHTDKAMYEETLFIWQKDDESWDLPTQREHTLKNLVLADLDGAMAREATINIFGSVQGIVADK